MRLELAGLCEHCGQILHDPAGLIELRADLSLGVSRARTELVNLPDLARQRLQVPPRSPKQFRGDRLVAPEADQGVGRVTVTYPNGERSAIEIPFSQGSAVYYFTHSVEPGIYRFDPSSDEKEISVSPRAVALNVKPAESNLATVLEETARNKLSAFQLAPPPKKGSVRDMVKKARGGRPIWDYLLMVALGLLTFETLYGNRLRASR